MKQSLNLPPAIRPQMQAPTPPTVITQAELDAQKKAMDGAKQAFDLKQAFQQAVQKTAGHHLGKVPMVTPTQEKPAYVQEQMRSITSTAEMMLIDNIPYAVPQVAYLPDPSYVNAYLDTIGVAEMKVVSLPFKGEVFTPPATAGLPTHANIKTDFYVKATDRAQILSVSGQLLAVLGVFLSTEEGVQSPPGFTIMAKVVNNHLVFIPIVPAKPTLKVAWDGEQFVATADVSKFAGADVVGTVEGDEEAGFFTCKYGKLPIV